MNTDLSALCHGTGDVRYFLLHRAGRVKDQKGPAARVTDLLKRCLIKIDGSEGLKCFGLLTELFQPFVLQQIKRMFESATFFFETIFNSDMIFFASRQICR